MKELITLVFVSFFLGTSSPMALDKNESKIILEKLDSIEKRLKIIEEKIENPFSKLLNKSLKQKEISKTRDEVKDKSKNIYKKINNSKKKSKIEDYLIVKAWDASEYNNSDTFTQNIELTYTLQNVSNKTILLIDGNLIFNDALNEKLGTFVVSKDFKMLPGETRTFNGIFKLGILTDKKIFRIISMDKKLIIPYLKVKQILFDDNEVIKF